MLQAQKDSNIIYNGKTVSLKKRQKLDVGKTFGFFGKEAKGVELFLKNKYGLVEAKEEVKDDSSKSDRRDS